MFNICPHNVSKMLHNTEPKYPKYVFVQIIQLQITVRRIFIAACLIQCNNHSVQSLSLPFAPLEEEKSAETDESTLANLILNSVP